MGFSSEDHSCNAIWPSRENVTILEIALQNHTETWHNDLSTGKWHKETWTPDPGSQAFYEPLIIQTQMLSGLPEIQIMFEDIGNHSFKEGILYLLVPIYTQNQWCEEICLTEALWGLITKCLSCTRKVEHSSLNAEQRYKLSFYLIPRKKCYYSLLLSFVRNLIAI